MARAKKAKAEKKDKTFVVLYHMNGAAQRKSEKMRKANPEAAAEGMKQWMDWAGSCGDALVDLGSPLGGGVALKSEGPATPSKRNVVGYSILKAPTMAAAKKLLKNHPHLGWTGGCEIELHEAQPMPGM